MAEEKTNLVNEKELKPDSDLAKEQPKSSVESLTELPQSTTTDNDSDDNELGDSGKKALKNERLARREAERKNRELEEKYKEIDLEKYRALLESESKAEAQRLALEQKRLQQEGKFEEARQQLEQTHKTKESAWREEKAGLLNQISQLSEQLEAATIKNALSQALTANGIVSEEALADMLNNDRIKSKVKYDPKKGRVFPVKDDGSEALDKEGNPYLSLTDWVTETVKPSRKYLFTKSVPSGSGGASNSTAPDPNKKNTLTQSDFAKMSAEELLRRKP